MPSPTLHTASIPAILGHHDPPKPSGSPLPSRPATPPIATTPLTPTAHLSATPTFLFAVNQAELLGKMLAPKTWTVVTLTVADVGCWRRNWSG